MQLVSGIAFFDQVAHKGLCILYFALVAKKKQVDILSYTRGFNKGGATAPGI